MSLNKLLLAERLLELSPKRKILMAVMINRLKDEVLFRKNNSIRFPCMVPDNLKESYSEQDNNFDRAFITYPFQADQRKMLELFAEIGIITEVKTNKLPGILKTSKVNLDRNALLELEKWLSEIDSFQPISNSCSRLECTWELYFDPVQQALYELCNGEKELIHKMNDPKYLRFWQYLFKHSYQSLSHKQIRKDLNILHFKLCDYLKNCKITEERKSRYFPKQESNRLLLFQPKITTL